MTIMKQKMYTTLKTLSFFGTCCLFAEWCTTPARTPASLILSVLMWTCALTYLALHTRSISYNNELENKLDQLDKPIESIVTNNEQQYEDLKNELNKD